MSLFLFSNYIQFLLFCYLWQPFKSATIEYVLPKSLSKFSESNNNSFELWSNSNTWTTNILPTVGDDVVINNNSWVLLESSIPRLNSLVIYGKLSVYLSEYKDILMMVAYVKVIGEFEIINNRGNKTVTLTLGDTPLQYPSSSLSVARTMDVYGTFRAYGRDVVQCYFSLKTTATRGDTVIQLDNKNQRKVSFNVGDTIVITPTAFYTAEGEVWSSGDKSFKSPVETRRVIDVSMSSTTTNSTTILITIDVPLSHTHLCQVSYNESFCGYVGVLTRSVVIKAPDDAKRPSTMNYAVGAVINFYSNHSHSSAGGRSIKNNMFDVSNVAFVNMGRAVDHTAGINLMSSSRSAVNNTVVKIDQCSFTNSLYLSIHCDSLSSMSPLPFSSFSSSSSAVDVSIRNNIFNNIWVGAISISTLCNNFDVTHNLVTGHYALPPAFMSAPSIYAFNSPIAAFTVLSRYGVFEGNKAAGSVDNAFAVAQTFFIHKAIHTPGFPLELCNCTYSQGLNDKYIQQLRALQVTDTQTDFLTENEAVGSRNGLTVVALAAHEEDPYEVNHSNCGLISSFKLWRNDNMGIISVDQAAQLVVFDSVLAENTVGLSLNVYAPEESNFFLGVIMSKVVGIIGNEKYNVSNYDIDAISKNTNTTTTTTPLVCSALPDTLWPLKYTDDTSSILASVSYSRVGIMSPQFLNAPQTCAFLEGASCPVPYALRSSCMLYGKRYGLPASLQYAEQHLYGNLFAGFCHNEELNYKTAAMTLNPSQADRLALPILENNIFVINTQPTHLIVDNEDTNDDLDSQLQPYMEPADIFYFREFDESIMSEECDTAGVCVRRKPLVTIVDVDGSVLKQFKPELVFQSINSSKSSNVSSAYGQIVFNERQLLQVPSSKCFNVGGVGLTEEFVYCPRDAEVLHAHWRSLGVNYNSVPAGFVAQTFRPFALYLSYWDDMYPTIYSFFNIRSHPGGSIIVDSNNRTNLDHDNNNETYYYEAPISLHPSHRDRDSYDFDFDKDGVPDDMLSPDRQPLDPRFTYGFQQISFSPEYEPCSGKILFNRRKQYFANGYVHYIALEDEEIFEWTISWMSPHVRFVHCLLLSH